MFSPLVSRANTANSPLTLRRWHSESHETDPAFPSATLIRRARNFEGYFDFSDVPSCVLFVLLRDVRSVSNDDTAVLHAGHSPVMSTIDYDAPRCCGICVAHVLYGTGDRVLSPNFPSELNVLLFIVLKALRRLQYTSCELAGKLRAKLRRASNSDSSLTYSTHRTKIRLISRFRCKPSSIHCIQCQ